MGRPGHILEVLEAMVKMKPLFHSLLISVNSSSILPVVEHEFG